jgi:hypothetical protein
MSCEIIQFSTAARIPSKRRKPIVLSAGTSRAPRVEREQEPERPRVRGGANMHTFLFRSRELILESDETDLVRDVCLNIDRAQTKLRQLRERLQGVQEWAAKQVEELTAAETKLSAAIVIAQLSTREEKSDGS